MNDGAQMAFPFDLSPCGPVVEAAAERAAWAAARESAADEDYRDAWDLYTPDFPEDV